MSSKQRSDYIKRRAAKKKVVSDVEKLRLEIEVRYNQIVEQFAAKDQRERSMIHFDTLLKQRREHRWPLWR
jgi:hypothetical protein